MLGIATFCGLFVLLTIGTWRRPAAAFAAILCLYGLKQWGQDSSAFLVEHRTIANFMAAILAGLGLFRMLGRERLAGPRSVSLPWLLGICLYLYAFATLAWTPDLAQALLQWGQQAPYVLLIVFAAPLLLNSYEDVKLACDWTVFVGGALCALALFLGHWGGRGLILLGNDFDQETNPLAIASLAGTVSVMAMLAIRHGAWWRKALCAVIVPIALATIVRSGSRGQLLATGIALLVGWPLVSSKRNLGTWLSLAAAAGALYLIGPWIWQHVGLDASRWSSLQSQQDVQGRLAMAVRLLQQAAASPGSLLFGLGNLSSFHYIGFYPHVVPAEILGEEGLIGLVIYLAFLAVTGRDIWRLQAALSADQSDIAARYAYGAMTALFVFELVLTTKEGDLLGSLYPVAYAAILGRIVVRNPTTAASAESRKGEFVLLPFQNLMR